MSCGCLLIGSPFVPSTLFQPSLNPAPCRQHTMNHEQSQERNNRNNHYNTQAVLGNGASSASSSFSMHPHSAPVNPLTPTADSIEMTITSDMPITPVGLHRPGKRRHHLVDGSNDEIEESRLKIQRSHLNEQLASSSSYNLVNESTPLSLWSSIASSAHTAAAAAIPIQPLPSSSSSSSSSSNRVNLKRTGTPIGSVHQSLRPSKRVHSEESDTASNANDTVPSLILNRSSVPTSLRDMNLLLGMLHTERQQRQLEWMRAQENYSHQNQQHHQQQQSHQVKDGSIHHAPSPVDASTSLHLASPSRARHITSGHDHTSFVRTSSTSSTSSMRDTSPALTPIRSPLFAAMTMKDQQSPTTVNGTRTSTPYRLPLSPLARFTRLSQQQQQYPTASQSSSSSSLMPSIPWKDLSPTSTSWAAAANHSPTTNRYDVDGQVFETSPWNPADQMPGIDHHRATQEVSAAAAGSAHQPIKSTKSNSDHHLTIPPTRVRRTNSNDMQN